MALLRTLRKTVESYETGRLRAKQDKALKKDTLPTLKINYLKELHIDIVHGCQLRCVGCPNSTLLDKVKKVDPEDFGRMLQHLDVKYIYKFGLYNYGEPLLHHDLPGILAKIRDRKIKSRYMEISTNAQTVNWEMLEESIRLKVLNRIVVSCDGDGSAEMYEKLRPPAKFDKLMTFFEKMQAIKAKHDPNLELVTSSIVNAKGDVEGWKKVVEPFGFKPFFREWKYLPEAQENLTGRAIEVPKGICMYQDIPSRFYVDWDGTVVPCCVHPQAGVIGNLKDNKLSEIMSGDARLRFLLQMRENREQMKICGSCEYGPSDDPGSSALSDLVGH